MTTPYQPGTPPYQSGQPQPPYSGPPIIINNSAAASAAAVAVGGRGRRRRQSAGVHIVLFFCTAGLGNLLYAWYVSSWNRRHGY